MLEGKSASEIMNLPQSEIRGKKVPTTYYYRNGHGKVISLTEEIAFEQHRLHPKFYGSSKDLNALGFSMSEAIAKFLEENVSNPSPPPDRRKMAQNYNPNQMGNNQEVAELKKQLAEQSKILKQIQQNGLHNEGKKEQDKGSNGNSGTTPQGKTS